MIHNEGLRLYIIFPHQPQVMVMLITVFIFVIKFEICVVNKYKYQNFKSFNDNK